MGRGHYGRLVVSCLVVETTVRSAVDTRYEQASNYGLHELNILSATYREGESGWIR